MLTQTEGVFGLGCDPDEPSAIARLLQIKQREKNKGLILIAANFSQLEPYIDVKAIAPAILDKIQQSWPGPVTWIVPKSERCSDWVSGQFDTVAVRVSDHPDVQALCHAFEKPVTSTSANLSGEPPWPFDVETFGHGLMLCLMEKQVGEINPVRSVMH